MIKITNSHLIRWDVCKYLAPLFPSPSRSVTAYKTDFQNNLYDQDFNCGTSVSFWGNYDKHLFPGKVWIKPDHIRL